jgi:excisionase family DNA binding protein
MKEIFPVRSGRYRADGDLNRFSRERCRWAMQDENPKTRGRLWRTSLLETAAPVRLTAGEAAQFYLSAEDDNVLCGATHQCLAMSVVELAKAISCSRSTVYALIKDKRIPARKLNGRTLISVLEAIRFIHGLPLIYE